MNPIRVCSFESRRCQEMATLIRKSGGEPTVAPSMREVPLEENEIARQFGERLIAGEFEIVIFMTGVGANTLFDAIKTIGQWSEFQAALDQRIIIVRGPKPVPFLKQAGIHIDHRAPEPNTWRELLLLLKEQNVDCQGKSIAVQEYGRPNEEFYQELEQQGATVFAVPVYRWEFPQDVEPMYAAIRSAVSDPFELVMFTSANQIDNVLQAAEQIDLKEQFLAAIQSSKLASIGPTCSERMQEFGLTVDMEPSHPKMGHLVRESLAMLKS